MTRRAYARIRDRLGTAVKRDADGKLTALCPAHDDKNPSLWVRDYETRIQVKCFAGCEDTRILAALNLTIKDLYDDTSTSYRYDNGRTVVRYWRPKEGDYKGFRQEHGDKPSELFHLAQLQASGDNVVYLVEGEADVEALESIGAVATSAPMGATNFAMVDVTPLTGRRVVAVVDRPTKEGDDSGAKWAADVYRLVEPIAARLGFVIAATGKDASDHVTAGYGLRDWLPYEWPESGTGEEAKDAEQPAGRTLRLTRASSLTARATRWLWEEAVPQFNFTTKHYGLIPLGALTLLGGREGIGKTTWSYRTVAKVTKGELPGDLNGQQRAVIICATEDAWEQTILPRLMASDADLDLVYRIEVEEDGLVQGLTLPTDMKALRDLCIELKVGLVVLDPLTGTLSKVLDVNKDPEVRRALEPLSRLADDAQLSVIGLIHENKSGTGDLMNRLMASRAFGAVARSVLWCAKEPDEDGEDQQDRFVFGQIKCNVGALSKLVVRYVIQGIEVGYDTELNKPINSSFIQVLDRTEQYLQELLSEIKKAKRQPSQVDKASKWLREYLKDGPVEAFKVKVAAEDAGFSASSMDRARAAIGIESVSIPGTANQRMWSLPLLPSDETDETDVTDETDETDASSHHHQLSQEAQI